MSLFDRQPSPEPRRKPEWEEPRASLTVPNFTGAPMEEKSKSGQVDMLIHALICLVLGAVIGGAMYEILHPLHKGHVKELWVGFFYLKVFYKAVGFWPAVLMAPAFGAFAAFCYFCKFLVTRYD